MKQKLCRPLRGQARSHRYSAVSGGCAISVGAGLPATACTAGPCLRMKHPVAKWHAAIGHPCGH
ncbi:hypothetical protein F9Z43_04255 [Pseudomonas monteilii]|uniref:Uncharacterized protein n=1 Tax=Pseudomonas monteilii TaxID=76759 RepID=A0A6G6UJA0_9PSED|nr:hypothetical protein [Pseudomonas monteilii]QIG18860.1 hypothetical protein FY041_14430 [Pseudomonas monteilii]QIG24115.1 hypothetical protein FY043_14425 [Pseudomonas monteilii]